MRKNLITLKPLQSSFLSVEQDTETLIRTLFIDTKPYSDVLKSLLVINEPDCLDTKKYKQVLDSYSIKKLIDNNYIRLNPRVEEMAHEDLKTTILISFDEFTPNQTNELFLNMQSNYSAIVARKVLVTISYLYIYEIYENKDTITLKDLENSYFNDKTKCKAEYYLRCLKS